MERRQLDRFDRRIWVPATVVVAVLFATASRYGFHRDELYFMVNSEHPAWGYVDHGPATPMLGWASQWIFGGSLFGLRALSAVIAGVIVIATAAVCCELGGGSREQRLAAWMVASSAVVLALGHMLTTPTIDVLVWTMAIWMLCRIIRTGDGRWFIALGAVLGVGLLDKFTVAFAVVGFGVAIVIIGRGRVMWTPWLLVGAVVGAAVAAPHLWWQSTHDWPILELSAGIADEATENRALAVPFQVLFIGPPLAVLVGLGWWRARRDHAVGDAAFIGIGFLLTLVMIVALAGKPYYAAGALPALIAVGALHLGEWSRRHVTPVAALVAVNAAVTAVLVLPILPVATFADSPISELNPEPAEMIGWSEFVEQVAAHYAAIDDANTIVLTGNYGEAGAIERFGPEFGLPPAYSGHNSYADVREPPGVVGPILVVGYGDPRDYLSGCSRRSHIEMPYGIDNEEQGTPVWVCATPREPWVDLWPRLRHIN